MSVRFFCDDNSIMVDDETIVKRQGKLQLSNKTSALNGQVFGKKDNGSFGFFEASGGGSGAVDVKQVTKLNVVAPKNIELYIPRTNDFKRLPVEVLKFKPGTQNVVNTVCEFDNGDVTDFEDNDMVIFDGEMSLRNEDSLTGVMNEGIYTISVNKGKYGRLVRLAVI